MHIILSNFINDKSMIIKQKMNITIIQSQVEITYNPMSMIIIICKEHDHYSIKQYATL